MRPTTLPDLPSGITDIPEKVLLVSETSILHDDGKIRIMLSEMTKGIRYQLTVRDEEGEYLGTFFGSVALTVNDRNSELHRWLCLYSPIGVGLAKQYVGKGSGFHLSRVSLSRDDNDRDVVLQSHWACRRPVVVTTEVFAL